MSRNPVRKRKSPYHHKVRNHIRQNRPVRQYERGKGDKPFSNPGRRRVVGGTSMGEFDISIFYIDEPSERFSVDAKDYRKALGAGIEMRDKPLPPRTIRMRMGRK